MTETSSPKAQTEAYVDTHDEQDLFPFREGSTPLPPEFLKGMGDLTSLESKPLNNPSLSPDMGQIAALMEAIEAEHTQSTNEEIINAVPQIQQEEKKGIGKILQAIKTFFQKIFFQK